MSDSLDLLTERRSIRRYQARRIPEELVRDVLTAAGWAPSAHNAQPWRFIVLVDSKIKRLLAEAMAKAWAADMAKDGTEIEHEEFNLRIERFAEAPALILACLSMEGMSKYSDAERQKVEHDLALASLAAAVENLLLAANSKSLGACWFCAPAFCKETVRQVLGIPADVEPQALIALGYPAEEPVAPLRKHIGDFCFRDGWGRSFG